MGLREELSGDYAAELELEGEVNQDDEEELVGASVAFAFAREGSASERRVAGVIRRVAALGTDEAGEHARVREC